MTTHVICDLKYKSIVKTPTHGSRGLVREIQTLPKCHTLNET